MYSAWLWGEIANGLVSEEPENIEKFQFKQRRYAKSQQFTSLLAINSAGHVSTELSTSQLALVKDRSLAV